jgi:CheY-like chemotaxis protein
MARFLVVEDDAGTQEIIARVIRAVDAQAEILRAPDGERARELVRSARPDLLVVDISLGGGMSGLELWEHCREHHPGIPLLFISGMPLDEYFRAIGPRQVAPPFLSKPLFIGECCQVIEGMLGRNPATEAG